MNIPSAEEIGRKFGKQVLIEVAAELGLAIDPTLHIWKLAEQIVGDLNENGVPMDEEVSDSLFDFLVYACFIQEDGSLIEFIDDGSEPFSELDDEQAGVKEEPELPTELPECFGWGEDRGYDENCDRCPIIDLCIVERDKNIADMTCFGVLYDAKDAHCMECTVWRLCQEKMEDK